MEKSNFSSLIAMLNELEREAVAQEFEAAPSSVLRWANGQSLPRPAMQLEIAIWLAKINIENCEDLNHELSEAERYA